LSPLSYNDSVKGLTVIHSLGTDAFMPLFGIREIRAQYF